MEHNIIILRQVHDVSIRHRHLWQEGAHLAWRFLARRLFGVVVRFVRLFDQL